MKKTMGCRAPPVKRNEHMFDPLTAAQRVRAVWRNEPNALPSCCLGDASPTVGNGGAMTGQSVFTVETRLSLESASGDLLNLKSTVTR
jgi:hypothetical protein